MTGPETGKPAGHSSSLFTRVDLAIVLGCFVLSFGLYVRTLAPDIVGADSAEFQFVPYVLGIAHPPGYPLYTLLGKLFTLLPFGSIAYRMNLMSAFFGAVTIPLVFLTVVCLARWCEQRLGGPGRIASVTPILGRVAAVMGACTLAVSSTWWNQSTVAAVRSLTGFFIALCVLLAVIWAVDRRRRWLHWMSFALGLSLTHHISMYTLLPAFVLFVLLIDWRSLWGVGRAWSLIWRFFLPMVIFLYLPIRSAMGSPFDPAHPTTLNAFLDLVLARGFAGDMFYFGWGDMPDRLLMLRELLLAQFDWFTLALATIGALAMLALRWRVLTLVGLVVGINVLISVTYKAPVIIDYLIPAYIGISVLAGLAVWAVGRGLLALWDRLLPSSDGRLGWWGRRQGWLAPLGATLVVLVITASLVLPARTLAGNYSSLDSSGYTELRGFVDSALRSAAPDSAILADWHDSAALKYAQLAEGARPDVSVVYVFPEGPKVPWVERVAERLGKQPVYITDYTREVAEQYRLRRVGPLLQVLAGPDLSLPDKTLVPGYREVNRTLDGRVALLGYSLEPSDLKPGEKLRLALYWRALEKPDKSYKVFVHLVDAYGKTWGQRDGVPAKWHHPTDEWVKGEVVMDEYAIFPFAYTPPGDYKIVVGMYEVLGDNKWRRLPVETPGAGKPDETIALTGLTVLPQRGAVVEPQFGSGRRFADIALLRGYDVVSWSGQSLRLALHWECLRAISGDFGVYLAATDATGSILAQQVDFPGSGAYPTSKWVAGDPVLDLHDVQLQSAPQGDLRVTIKLVRPGGEDGLVDAAPAEGGDVVLTLSRELNDPGRVRLDFGGKTLLTGWRAVDQPARPGGELVVELNWEPLGSMWEDCSTFVHLLGPDGKVWAQHDGVPVAGAYPTLRWVRGHVVVDSHRLKLPADIPPGEYRLQIGMYVLRTGERWPLLNRSIDDILRDGQIDTLQVGPVMVAR